jgi:hypothetical protein
MALEHSLLPWSTLVGLAIGASVACNAVFGINEPHHRAAGAGAGGMGAAAGSGGVSGRGGSASPTGGSSGEAGSSAGSPEGGPAGSLGVGGAAASGGSAAAGQGGTPAGGSGPGAGGSDAGAAGSPANDVEITAPAETAYTNGTVSVEILVQGNAESLDFLVDDKVKAHLGAGRSYAWDTTSVAEGSHKISARASFAGTPFDSAPRTVVVDRTAPKVKARTPTPNDDQVFIGEAITATFSEPLDPNSVIAGNVTLTVDDVKHTADATLSDDGKTIALDPFGTIVAPAALNVTLSTGIKDRAGNRLVAADSWGWHLPEWVPIGGVTRTSTPNECFLALAPDGTPSVVLTDAGGDAAVFTYDGIGWNQVGGSLNLTQEPVTVAYLVNVAGKLTVALKEADASGVANGYVVQWNGTAWVQLGGAINPIGAANIQDALPATNTKGDLAIGVWQGQGGVAPYHAYILRWNGSSFDQLGDGSGYNAVPGSSLRLKPAIALDEHGQPYMALQELDTNYDVYVATYTDQKGWANVGGKVNPTPGFDVGGQGLLAISKLTDRPFTAMLALADTPTDAYALRWTDTDWAKIGGAINPVPGQEVTYGTKAFALTSGDRPVLAVVEENGSGTKDAYVVKWNDSDWVTIGSGINPIVGRDINRLRMALDPEDRPVISMLDDNDITNTCYVYRSNNK